MQSNSVSGMIKDIHISGFKSIRDSKLRLNNLNIFIGANGSGKSNLMSFFNMLQYMIANDNGLQHYVGRNGGANKLLHYGYKATQTINAQIEFANDKGENYYSLSLTKSAGDSLFFADEKIAFTMSGSSTKMHPVSIGGGHLDTKLNSIGANDEYYSSYYKTITAIKKTMRKWQFYQFHDTTPDSRIRGTSDISDCNYLRDGAGNLSAFLYMLRDRYPNEYKIILLTVRQIAPFIEDFVLEREFGGNSIQLKWKEHGKPDYTFAANQMSDGTLRMIALVTLLLQPKTNNTPKLICIDEPELGLHPAAIELLGELFVNAAKKVQIIISTQSPSLVDCFDIDDIIIVNRKNGESIFERLDDKRYKEWLDEFTISQLWNTNIFGGRPSK